MQAQMDMLVKQVKALDLLVKRKKVSHEELAKHLGVSLQDAKRILDEMARTGLVKRHKSGEYELNEGKVAEMIEAAYKAGKLAREELEQYIRELEEVGRKELASRLRRLLGG